jgi:hypothetical protein
MFGSANVLTAILEVKNGDIYNPTTLQKLDQMTRWIVESKGVVPYQITSIAHPKMKSITTVQGAIEIREVFYPACRRPRRTPIASSSRSTRRRASAASTSRRTTRPRSSTPASGRKTSTSTTSGTGCRS